MECLVDLVAADKRRVHHEVQQFVQQEQLSICISGDVWSENGIALLAILGYWIDSDWQYQEQILTVQGFHGDAHTGQVIKDMTVRGLVEAGLGTTEQEVLDHVHACTPDEGSNMLKAWKGFEGAGCVCHR